MFSFISFLCSFISKYIFCIFTLYNFLHSLHSEEELYLFWKIFTRKILHFNTWSQKNFEVFFVFKSTFGLKLPNIIIINNIWLFVKGLFWQESKISFIFILQKSGLNSSNSLWRSFLWNKVSFTGVLSGEIWSSFVIKWISCSLKVKAESAIN